LRSPYCFVIEAGLFQIDEVALDFLSLGVRADLAHRLVPAEIDRIFQFNFHDLFCDVIVT